MQDARCNLKIVAARDSVQDSVDENLKHGPSRTTKSYSTFQFTDITMIQVAERTGMPLYTTIDRVNSRMESFDQNKVARGPDTEIGRAHV